MGNSSTTHRAKTTQHCYDIVFRRFGRPAESTNASISSWIGHSLNSVIVIPARLESTRLPRKLLLRETGRSLLQHTCESAAGSLLAERVVVAADDPEIVAEVERFGGVAVMTSPAHLSGTDRVAEVAGSLGTEIEIVVNVQGDEPEIEGATIDLAIGLLKENPDVPVATLATPIRDRQLLDDPSCVKVVFNADFEALYFSRAPIPYPRTWSDDLLNADPAVFHLHIGLYAYRRDFLLKYDQLAPSKLQTTESLEQLRILEAGHTIVVGIVDQAAPGIDTAEDYRAFVERSSQ